MDTIILTTEGNNGIDAARYQVQQKGHRYYVIDTHRDVAVGITRTSHKVHVYGLNQTQANMLAELCNHIDALES